MPGRASLHASKPTVAPGSATPPSGTAPPRPSLPPSGQPTQASCVLGAAAVLSRSCVDLPSAAGECAPHASAIVLTNRDSAIEAIDSGCSCGMLRPLLAAMVGLAARTRNAGTHE